MILDHQKFDLEDKCLIEKLIIQAPFKFAVDFPNSACFVYFLEGKANINSPYEQVGVGPEEPVLLKCGSYFVDLMKHGLAGRYEILVVHLYPEILRKIYAHDLPSFIKHSENKTFIDKIAHADIIKKFIESLRFYFDHRQMVSDELMVLKLKELVLLLVQTKNAASVESLFTDLFTPREVSIKDVVNDHLFSGLSIEDLARLSNLSVSTFNRTFQFLFNDTPGNYLKLKRLERAKDLLVLSSLTISEIAFQTCFNDLAHFSRSFKGIYRYSPSEFRKSLKKSRDKAD